MGTRWALVASVVRPGTRAVVGRFAGPIAGTGYGFTLVPGASRDVPVTVGTARCDGRRGSLLPPGRYGVRVSTGATETAHDHLSNEVPIALR